jgi:hypothetical protein
VGKTFVLNLAFGIAVGFSVVYILMVTTGSLGVLPFYLLCILFVCTVVTD